jgi:hypothetical protein
MRGAGRRLGDGPGWRRNAQVATGNDAARGSQRLGVDLRGLRGHGGRRRNERAGSVARGGRRDQ